MRTLIFYPPKNGSDNEIGIGRVIRIFRFFQAEVSDIETNGFHCSYPKCSKLT